MLRQRVTFLGCVHNSLTSIRTGTQKNETQNRDCGAYDGVVLSSTKRPTNDVVTADHTLDSSTPSKRVCTDEEPQAGQEGIPELPQWRDSIPSDHNVPASIASAAPVLSSTYLPDELPEDLYEGLADMDKDTDRAARFFVACSQKMPAFGGYFAAHPLPTTWGQGRSGLEPIDLTTAYRGGQPSLSVFYCGLCYSPGNVRAAVGAAEAVRIRPTSKDAATWRVAIKKLKAVIIDNPFDADLHLACDMHTNAVKAKARDSSKVPNSGAAVPVAAGEMEEQVRALHTAIQANATALATTA
jgi:hypothetical protein